MQATVKYRMVTMIDSAGTQPMRKHYASGEYETLEYAVAAMFRQNSRGTFLWSIEPVITGVTP
jgi:hypothetical protein